MYFQLCSASLQHRKAGGKEGTGTNDCRRSPSPESTPLQGSKSSHPIPLEQHCQSAGSVTEPHSAQPPSPKGAFRIITGHFPCREQPLQDIPRDMTQGRNQNDFQDTVQGPNPWTFHTSATSAPFLVSLLPKGLSSLPYPIVEFPSIKALQQSHCPRHCCEAMHGRTPGTMILLKTASLCPTTSLQPDTPPHCSQLLPKTMSCPWLQQPQRQCGEHGAEPYMGTKPGSRGTLSAQLCSATGTSTSWCPGTRCHA